MRIIPKTCQAAVMTQARCDLEFREYPVPLPTAREALVRVRCCTICRSDLHTWQGKRGAPLPVILGHEIVGEIVALGSERTVDATQAPLAVGDRVTWTLHSSCGHCIYCGEYQLPMKCLHLKKYGHDNCEVPPHLQGGFAEYCLIDSGTSILKIPDHLSYRCAAPLNCAAATVVAGLDAAEFKPGESVLIQGAGGLGCYAAAFAKLAGAKQIIVVDISSERLEFIKHFGATHTLNAAEESDGGVIERVRALTTGYGADCALELAGVPALVPVGCEALRKGGRYVEIGCCFPDASVVINLSTILSNRLTIRGVHNYDVRDLRRAMGLVSQSLGEFPYEQLVAKTFSLQQINSALKFAEVNTTGRVAVEVAE